MKKRTIASMIVGIAGLMICAYLFTVNMLLIEEDIKEGEM